MLTPFPSATAFALALGARLTLRGLTLRRNPWTFGVRVSHPHYRYSCQHSHFRYLHSRSRDCFAGLRNAPLPRPEDRRQRSEIRLSQLVGKPCSIRAISRYSLSPALANRLVDIAEIDGSSAAIPASRPPTRSPSSESAGTRASTASAGRTLRRYWRRSISTPAGSDRPGPLLDPPETQARSMHLQRHPIGALEHLEILERTTRSLIFHLSSVSDLLSSEHPQLRCVA